MVELKCVVEDLANWLLLKETYTKLNPETVSDTTKYTDSYKNVIRN